MTVGIVPFDLFDPASLPAPDVLSRRHRAVVVVSQAAPDHGYLPFEWDAARSRGRWDNQSGEEFTAYFVGEEALIFGLAHESPYSPWPREDGAREWPGMFAGLPPHLEALLDADPAAEARRNASFAFWYVGGAWHRGDPEPSEEEEWWPEHLPPPTDPQGVRELGPLVFDDTAGEYVGVWYRDEGLADAFLAVLHAAAADEPLTTRLLEPFASGERPVETLLAAAAKLDLRLSGGGAAR